MMREMDRLQRQIHDLFDGFDGISTQRRRIAPSYPAINVWADEDSVLITAEIPGIDSSDIELNVLNDTLTLSGSRQNEQLPEDARYHRQERRFGQFTRSLKLPYSVDVDNVEANFKHGVLEITLPRTEADRPKKISVKSS
jgi:HSP20 family protein